MTSSRRLAEPNPVRFAGFLAGRFGGELQYRLGSTPGLDDVVLAHRRDLDAPDASEDLAAAAAAVIVGERSEQPDLELARLATDLDDLGLTPEFTGLARWEGRGGQPDVAIAVLRGAQPPRVELAPDGFRVIALVMAYNEADVIGETIGHLARHGIDTYLVDNWSTDDTLERAQEWSGQGLVGWERFPSDGRRDTWQLREVLRRFEELSTSLDAEWFIRNDADEFREPPWPGVRLVDAIHHAQACGFSAINHTLLNFALTDESRLPHGPPLVAQRWFAPGNVADRTQVNAWRRSADPVSLAQSGGHDARFEGRRIFPYNFLLRHYPVRSLEQAARKVFADRLPRFDDDERASGWHSHYDDFGSVEDLVVPSAGLVAFDDDFPPTFLIERLSGIGFGLDLDPPGVKHAVARALKRVGLWDAAQSMKRRIR